MFFRELNILNTEQKMEQNIAFFIIYKSGFKLFLLQI